MQIELAPLFSGEVNRLPFTLEEQLSGDFPDCDVSFPMPIRVSGSITNQAGYLAITLEAFVSYETVCARCLAPIQRDCTLSMEKGVASASSLEDKENDDYLLLDGTVLRLDEAVSDLIYLNLPQRHLCREDCRGYCLDCGKNLNEGDCDCRRKTVDPRLAILAQLLEDKNE